MADAGASIDFGLDAFDPSTWLPALLRVGTYTVGTGTPAEQITSSVIVIAGAIASSVITLGATLFIVFVALPFLLIGFLRLIPAVNARWPL